MTFDQTAILAILLFVLILFLWGKWRYDIVALIALFISVLIGVVPDELIFSGFGHPATITVAIVLIISYGLARSGAIEGIASILALEHGIIPPTINHETVDENIDPQLNLTLNKAQNRDIKVAMSNTFGFGGHNACVVFKKLD